MLSDERLETVEQLVSESLNEDASLQKVRPLQTLTMAGRRLFVSGRDWRDQRSGVRCEGDHIILCERVKIKLMASRQIVTPFSTSPARHTRRTSETSMRCIVVSPRSMTYRSNSYIRSRGFCFPSGRGILLRGNYPGVSPIYLCEGEDGFSQAWNW